MTGKSWKLLVTIKARHQEQLVQNTYFEPTSGKETGIGMTVKYLHRAVYAGLTTRPPGLIIGRSKVRVLPGPPFIFLRIRYKRFTPLTFISKAKA